MSKEVSIELDECMGCGACIELCPEVFGLDEEENKAYVIDGANADQDCIEEAMASCPGECIAIEG